MGGYRNGGWCRHQPPLCRTMHLKPCGHHCPSRHQQAFPRRVQSCCGFVPETRFRFGLPLGLTRFPSSPCQRRYQSPPCGFALSVSLACCLGDFVSFLQSLPVATSESSHEAVSRASGIWGSKPVDNEDNGGCLEAVNRASESTRHAGGSRPAFPSSLPASA